MSEERTKILEMVARGTITAADAERLLDRLSTASESKPGRPSPASARCLRIQVDRKGVEPVDIRIPLGFLRSGIALGAIVPERVAERLKERGVDLSALSSARGEELVEALRRLDMQVESRNGKTVRIYCE
jgi:hypothetical protein